MENFYEEIKNILKYHKKTLDDIKWVGARNYTIDKDKFFEDIKNLEYDSGYGLEVINLDLIIVGDNFYLTRWEYDGSEGFEYITMPVKPKNKKEYSRDFVISDKYLRDFKWKGK